MNSARTGSPCTPKYASGELITWYSRPPTMPNGTAQKAISSTVSGSPPRAAQRRRAIQSATTMPIMIAIA